MFLVNIQKRMATKSKLPNSCCHLFCSFGLCSAKTEILVRMAVLKICRALVL